MYRHCTFCAADLGSNEVLEHFPVGRRLAFDAAKGRLWVICRQCERWNLTPLEERWEAVEDAERIFRATRLRASTDQVGLARHLEGTELVRIGAPIRPEFAAWRYGDQFGRRRLRYLGYGVVGVGVAGGVVAGSVALLGGMLGVQVLLNGFQVMNAIQRKIRPKLRMRLDSGGLFEFETDLGLGARLRPGPGEGAAPGTDPGPDDAPWHLAIGAPNGSRILTGPDAVRALRLILPKANAAGAGRSDVKTAVAELERAGTAEGYFADVDRRARKLGWGFNPVSEFPTPLRLALEMAANEDTERVALEGELAWLETAWKEAEEVAAIADSLALPDRVRLHFAELKARRGRASPSEEPPSAA